MRTWSFYLLTAISHWWRVSSPIPSANFIHTYTHTNTHTLLDSLVWDEWVPENKKVADSWGGTLSMCVDTVYHKGCSVVTKSICYKDYVKIEVWRSLVCWNESRILPHPLKAAHACKHQWPYNHTVISYLHIFLFGLSWESLQDVLTSEWSRWISQILYLLAVWLWESYFLLLNLSFTICTLEIIMPTSMFKVRIKMK